MVVSFVLIGVGVQQDVIAHAVVIPVISAGAGLGDDAGGAIGGIGGLQVAVIDDHVQLGGSDHVVVPVQHGVGLAGDIGQEGVHHDDVHGQVGEPGALDLEVHLGDAALTAHTGDGVGGHDLIILGGGIDPVAVGGLDVEITVDIQAEGLGSAEALVLQSMGHVALTDLLLGLIVGHGRDGGDPSAVGRVDEQGVVVLHHVGLAVAGVGDAGTDAVLVPIIAGTAKTVNVGPASGVAQTKDLLPQGLVEGAVDQAVLVVVSQGRGVGDSGHDGRGHEDQVGHHFTGSGHVQGLIHVRGGHVLGDAQLTGQGGHVDLPLAAGELIVLAVADHAQDHRQGLIPGDLPIGVEGGGGGALDVPGVLAVADVTGKPVAAVHIGEGAIVLVQVVLAVVHIAGGHAVDDGGRLSAGDGVAGAEAVLVALEDLQAGQHLDAFDELGGDAVLILIVLELDVGGAGGQHEAERHDHRQDEGEKLLQVSHWICFLLIEFCRFSGTSQQGLIG